MEKKEFQKLFKNYMKGLGFQSRGNNCCKFLTNDYMIFVMLEHCSYRSAYYVKYGAVYEANQMQKPFSGKSDWSSHFYFTSDKADDLTRYPLEDQYTNFEFKLINWFDYTERSADDFVQSMEENVKQRLNMLTDKEFILEQYRQNWVSFRRIPYDTVHKVCRLAGLDATQVIEFRDGRCR